MWVIRELQAALAADDAHAADNTTNALSTFLREGTWVAGQVPPIVGSAITSALDALELLGPYEVGRGNNHCFGSLTASLEASMRSSEVALAAIVCASLQAHFAEEIQQSLDQKLSLELFASGLLELLSGPWRSKSDGDQPKVAKEATPDN